MRRSKGAINCSQTVKRANHPSQYWPNRGGDGGYTIQQYNLKTGGERNKTMRREIQKTKIDPDGRAYQQQKEGTNLKKKKAQRNKSPTIRNADRLNLPPDYVGGNGDGMYPPHQKKQRKSAFSSMERIIKKKKNNPLVDTWGTTAFNKGKAEKGKTCSPNPLHNAKRKLKINVLKGKI